MLETIRTWKAQCMMKVAGFIAQNHDNPFKQKLADLLAWANRNQHGKDTLDFLEDESSIDHLDFSDLDSAIDADADKAP